MAPGLFGAAIWAMPGVAAMEENSASRPSGAAFDRNPRDRVLANKCARENTGAERRPFSKIDKTIIPTANA
jgi:hypothetical protein